MPEPSREERRRQEREQERKREEELDKVLDEPRLPSFEAPASGTIVGDAPRTPPRKR